MCGALHQFMLVGGEHYHSRAELLARILERLPAQGGMALVFAEEVSVPEVERIISAHQRSAAPSESAALNTGRSVPVWPQVATPLCKDRLHFNAGSKLAPMVRLPSVKLLAGRAPQLQEHVGRCQYVINYDAPSTGREYLRRLCTLVEQDPAYIAAAFGVAATFYEEGQLGSRRCREVVGLLRRARRAAGKDEELGGAVKASEFDSALQQLESSKNDGDEEEEDEDATGDDSEDADSSSGSGHQCDCIHCRNLSVGSASYHASVLDARFRSRPQVEVMHVPLRALKDLEAIAPLIAPRLSPVCTLICLHNLNCHTPWGGSEHLFALPDGMGAVRVVLVLAEACSWHDYPDVGAFSGGVAWMDIIDMDSANRTDELLEKLVDHEAALLNGQSERIILMGVSQGGGQSMLRFLRSRRRLGGWVGAVCHAPTAPHVPREKDPLTLEGRPLLNCDRPMRLLAGQVDCVFPASLVLRDAERLRTVGGFSDVRVEVRAGLTHEGDEQTGPPQELVFVQEHLPGMLAKCLSPGSPELQ